MGGDLPGVSPFVLDHAATISIRRIEWLFNRLRLRLKSALVAYVYVFNVYVKEAGRHFTHPGLANHNPGIADCYHRWSINRIGASCVEDLFRKSTNSFAPWTTILGVTACQPSGMNRFSFSLESFIY